MAQTIIVAGATYPDVPSIVVPKASGGTAEFVDADTIVDVEVVSQRPTASSATEGHIFFVTGG